MHGQTDAGGLGAHPLQQTPEIPWDPQLAGEMQITPICPRQKPHLLPSPPPDSLPEPHGWSVQFSWLCVLFLTITEHNLLAMSINTQ